MSRPGVRLTYEFVRKYFSDHGCELLDTEYTNARSKLRYRCSCGAESSIVFDSFRQGNRCRACGTRKTKAKLTLTQAEVEKQFREGGCELLDTYTHSRTRMRYRCSCGTEDRISLNNFQKGHRCWDCGVKKRSGENHYEWEADRAALAERPKFRQRSYKLVTMTMNVTGRVKNTKTAALLGYTYEDLQRHITTHPNYQQVQGQRWHIDHIFPITAFAEYGISDLAVINALDNLRPLGYKENIQKSDKYDRSEFEAYLTQKGISWKS